MPKNTTRQTFEKNLASLVSKFEQGRGEYMRLGYPEAEVRSHFIDPLFQALGWDMPDERALGKEREVTREVSEKSGRPDYAFRIDSRKLFYVEAKAPHVPLERTDVILQVKRYAWSASVDLGLVTDFEEFRIYDTGIKPNRKKPDAGLIRAFHYSDYLQPETIKILWLLSRESVAANGIAPLLELSPIPPRQRKPVDLAFLDDLTDWREELAKSVFKIHPTESADLNNIVQVFLDRLIFIRVTEDRAILPDDLMRLQGIARRWENHTERASISRELNELFSEINKRFNGDVFKKHPCEDIDWDLNAELVVGIINGLYEPYRFDVIPVELLGSIYERYLGKTIRVTEKRAIVEDKPEVRKAGGVYYTPKYIVDYIVAQTVGKLIEGKTPKQIEKLRVLDPACGSGSFLLGAYQTLLDYHTRYYATQTKRADDQPRLIDEREGGEFKLSLEQKRAILQNNIFGVDIDPQAVEITMMSLYIKMLEGERGAIMGSSVLPRLRDNIKCGNSLIGYDIGDLSDDDKTRINPFDWNSKSQGFGAIMSAGGFDTVIGNPPYLGGREWKEEGGRRYDYFIKKFAVAEYQFDVYALFWEQGIRLLKQSGLISFITPNTWLNNKGTMKLRRYILENTSILSVTDYSRVQVFPKVVVLPIISVLQKTEKPTDNVEIYKPQDGAIILSHVVSRQLWLDDEQKIFNIDIYHQDVELRQKIEDTGIFLDELADVKFGIKLYETGKGTPPQKASDAQEHIFEASRKINAQYRPYLEGKDINRYEINWQNRWLKYGKNLAAPRDPELFEGKRLLIRRIVGVRLIGTFTESDYVTSQLLQIVKPHNHILAQYLLGILNSSLIAYYFKKKYNRQDKTFPEIRIYELSKLPIRTINLADLADKVRHDKMVTLVEKMLDLHRQNQAAKSDTTRERIEREIHVTDEQIDTLVYELYGLTKEEIKIVEG